MPKMLLTPSFRKYFSADLTKQLFKKLKNSKDAYYNIILKFLTENIQG